MKKYFLLLVILLLALPVGADDTEIYGVSTIDVKPNVLIVFDNSGSMSTADVLSEKYDPSVTYPGPYSTDGVYRYAGWWWGWTDFFDDINSANWHDSVSRAALLADGYWRGAVYKTRDGLDVYAGGRTYSYRLGNYMNFLAQGTVEYERRMVVAKGVIAKLIYDNYAAVNFGVMKFHTDQGGFIVEPCGATKAELIGNYDPATTVFTDSDQSADFGAIGGMYSYGWTPLAETLAEAGLYFAGEAGWFNDVTYDSPIQYRCQKNYIIVVTDGEPTQDDDKIDTTIYLNGKKIPELGKDGTPNYMEDVAYFLANEDLRPDLGETGDFPEQTISTYTVGFAEDLPFLEQVATNGNGEYFPADSASTLGEALNNIISAIGERNEQFSSTAVPVNSDDGFTAGNYVYFGLFQPVSNNNWAGNLKKYALDGGVIKDQNGLEAVLANGTFADNSTSFWSSSIDGNSVTAGGVGEVLSLALENGGIRSVYTYTGTEPLLTDSTNQFVTDNTALTDGSYDGLTTSVISAVRQDNSDGSWPLGSFIHSEPLVVHYGTTQTMIYIGGNDGMLHCFDDADGSELWGFIPPDLLGGLSVLEAPTELHYFVDGSPTLFSYVESNVDKKIVMFGERRGGYNYTALDVSDPAQPSFKYSVAANILTAGGGGEPLGQSWGRPQSRQMVDPVSNTPKDVFLLPGGYDAGEDLIPAAAATQGRAIFAVDSKTGALFSGFNVNHANFTYTDPDQGLQPLMTHSIVAVAGFENPESRTTTRVYAADLGGNLFALRDDTYDGEEDGVWEQQIRLFSSPGKKIFYKPNITNEYYWVKYPYDNAAERTDPPALRRIKGDYVFYGTGDRAHPSRTDITNEFYAIKNNWQWEDSSGNPISTPTIVKAYVDSSDGKIKKIGTSTVIGADDLFILDITDDLYQNTETDTATRILYSGYIVSAINNMNNRGWYLRLVEADGSSVGEKVVSTPIIFNGAVYYTTYVPDDGTCATDDPCAESGASGTGYLYALDYRYGGSVINFDQSTDDELTRSDRRLALRTTGIPTEPRIVTPKDADPYLIIGKQKIALPPLKGVQLFYWRQVTGS